jgi:uncharacterized BrkB/YihY/UPF0761 family membrane protein
MVKHEWILNLVLFIFGTVIALESFRLGLGGLHRPGVGFLPFYTGALLALVAFFSLVKNLRITLGRKWDGNERFFGRAVFNLGGILIAVIVYVIIFPLFGYLLSTFLLLVALFRAAGIRKWGHNLLTTFLTVAITYLVFFSWLHIQFPKGILGF